MLTMLQAWLSKLSRRTFGEEGSSAAGDGEVMFSPLLVQTITQFFNQEGFVQVKEISNAASKPTCLRLHSIERVDLICL